MTTAILTVLLAVSADAARKHTVVPKDCMWDLAQHYYKDPFQWRKIADANPPPDVKDPHWIYPDQVLIIPDIDEDVPEPEEPAPEEAATTPAAPIQPVTFQSDQGEQTVTVPESLSTKFPEGLVSAPPSNYRMMALPGWTADGSVAAFNGTEIMAAEGDLIDLAIERGKPSSGDRYEVYRKAAPTEADTNKAATYVVKIGVVQLRKPVAGNRFRAVILKSNDSVQIGDLIVKAAKGG
ncbi:MAG: LysM peptidoglycan-binding domain-containing protein [Elusimicrobia bacterium]|nr:LysM peptidoglycan-binding domain-containing protein [Elusimicrobiota bacterium]